MMTAKQASTKQTTETAATVASLGHIGAQEDHGHHGHQAQNDSSSKHWENLSVSRNTVVMFALWQTEVTRGFSKQ
jgi:hypothetical protein